MAQFFVPSKQIFAPELLVPGKKPVGFTEIDCNSGFRSPNVILVPSSGTPINLVTGVSLVPDANALTSAGSMRFTGSTNEQYKIEDSLIIDYQYITFYIKFDLSTLGVFRRIFSRGSDGATKSRIDCLVGSNDQFRVDFYDEADVLRNYYINSYAVLGQNTFAFTYNGSRAKSIINGVYADVSLNHGPIKTTTGNPLYIGSYHNGFIHPFNGNISDFLTFHAPVSQGALWSLYKDPYQILKPTGPQWFSFDAGGAPTTKPALLMSAGQIKQYTDESPNRPLCINADGSVEGYLVVAGKKPLVVDTGDTRVLSGSETLDR